MAHTLFEIGGAFLRLGCTSFGGPVAHLGYFREEFVVRRRWLDDAEYADLVALCQFLPGPASSQVVFALGRLRGGLAGAVLASACFTLPSAVLMIGFAYGLAGLGGLAQAGWVHGLKLAAVAVVAQAVWGMGRALCPDWPRRVVALAAAGVVLAAPGAIWQIAAIVAGAAAGWSLYRRVPPPAAAVAGADKAAREHNGGDGDNAAGAPRPQWSAGPRHSWGAAGALIACAALLLILPAAAAAADGRMLSVFDSFYRAGALVFGGGHVLLPLLRAEVVPPGWVADDAFLAGYGAAQALPGPLFTFAGYLGTLIHGGTHAWVGGLTGLVAIFLPAWLLIGGALPFWQRLKSQAWAQAALRGANAAVVGILLAALYHPVGREGITSWLDAGFAVAAFAALQFGRVPPWLVVAAAAAAGAVWPQV